MSDHPNAQERVELLAPAGSYDALVAAVENGADAVYLGGEVFNARKFAANFSDDELARAIDLAHVRGVKVFLTLNTLIFDHEFPEAVAFLRKVRRMGADAVIVQDLGIMRAVRELVPDLPLHISTQATVHNTRGIRFLEDLGAERVILARENTLKEMARMREETGAELEQFVHGAMCYCYSGQCLMSSVIGGRSGNRGACAYTCRLPYTMEEGEGAFPAPPGGSEAGPNVTLLEEGPGTTLGESGGEVVLADDGVLSGGTHPSTGAPLPANPIPGFLEGKVDWHDLESAKTKHVLSARDMNTLESVPELIAAGVTSFKIEGRMKRPEYVAIVTRAYRNAIDRAYGGDLRTDPGEAEAVRRVFNRAFNSSWLHGKEKWAFTNWDTAGNQGVPLGTVVASGRGWVSVRLEDTLRVRDGVEILHLPEHDDGHGGAPEDYGFTVTEMFLEDGRYTSEAVAGEVVTLKGRQWSVPGDPVYKTADIEVLERARATYEDGPHRRVPVRVEARLHEGEPLTVRLTEPHRGVSVEHTSEHVVAPARKAPMTLDNAQVQLEKLGETPFEAATVEVDLRGSPFVPLSVLNEARRAACEALVTALAERHHRPALPEEGPRTQRFLSRPVRERPADRPVALTVNCWGLPNLHAALEAGADQVYFSGLRVGGLQPTWDTEALDEAVEAARARGARLYIASGMVQKDPEVEALLRALKAQEGSIAGVLAGNHGAFHAALEAGLPVVGDWPLNVYNAVTVDYLRSHANERHDAPVERVTLSPEITLEDVRRLSGRTDGALEVLAHGRLTLMTSEYCSIGHATRCQLPGGTWAPCHDRKYRLRDRLGKEFPLETDGACRMYILNAVELNMIDRLGELRAAGVDAVRIETIGATPEVTAVQVRTYREALEDLAAGRPFDKAHWDALKAVCPDGFTTGHFYRGPE